ncbi:LPS O-antigen chain length determinant protein, WzzB/FepE family [Desulfuromusa kysingii]|uniref:LPS O-antigen chain length determinant protein, WzzB/FepE family n=1 Tax=Desulfuromusa kysingii TaxID=37625 RepID=A0A1H3YGM4_9BACT|nr:Wzz/FepE/Etk N-terminal domain-containing protein [Desulfuromusa kysingii]SEA10730.1 LPS O-antigen chain length determinant protein, WzzB/FepE family [Desulfuromusa kysingii]
MNQVGPESELEQHRTDDEIDLVELFLILWKRKWLIVVVTLLATFAAAGVSMIMPKVYAVTAILEPGKDAEGHLVENPQSIRENILGGAYHEHIAKQLNLAFEDIPEIHVTVPKSTDLIKISIETSSPEVGVSVLNELLTVISSDLRDQLEVKTQKTMNKIKLLQLDEQTLDEQLRLLDNQLVQIVSRMSELEAARSAAIASPHSDAMAVLLYSNEIKDQQIYRNDLQMKRADIQSSRRQSAIKIENEKLSLSAINSTSIHKQPLIPGQPIKPKKTLIVALGFVLGFMAGIMMAFLAEFMHKVKQQSQIVAGERILYQ